VSNQNDNIRDTPWHLSDSASQLTPKIENCRTAEFFEGATVTKSSTLDTESAARGFTRVSSEENIFRLGLTGGFYSHSDKKHPTVS